MLNTVFANDVRQTLDTFRRSVDQLFDTFMTGRALPEPDSRTREAVFSPAVESFWGEAHLHLRAILPGVRQQDLKVTVQNNQLIFEGERKAPENWGKSAFYHMAYGRFYAAFDLPAGMNLENVECILHDGVLDINIPVAEASKPKQIKIQAAETRKAIGA